MNYREENVTVLKHGVFYGKYDHIDDLFKIIFNAGRFGIKWDYERNSNLSYFTIINDVGAIIPDYVVRFMFGEFEKCEVNRRKKRLREYKEKYSLINSGKGKSYDYLFKTHSYIGVVRSNQDTQLREYNIRVRSKAILPDPWDSEFRGRTDYKCWKKYRKTQWKPK